jgi:hypothetical protein
VNARPQVRSPPALTEDTVEMEFLTDDPVALAVTCQPVTSDAGAGASALLLGE